MTSRAEVLILPPAELDPSTCDVLAASLDAVDPAADVVVDFAGVSFCDSSGLRVLIVGSKRQQAGGGRIRVVNARPRVARVFALTGLDGLLDGPPDAEAPIVDRRAGAVRH